MRFLSGSSSRCVSFGIKQFELFQSNKALSTAVRTGSESALSVDRTVWEKDTADFVVVAYETTTSSFSQNRVVYVAPSVAPSVATDFGQQSS